MNDSSVAHSIAAGSASSAATLSERSGAVAAVAARHAPEVDSAPRFPAESFAAVKAQRLLGILVPSNLGG
ncbi:MAG TPA: hypothetical protein VL176_04345, partial [Steroidobacteraceae bacterium]|nr:hypothetical protein [Steroidobacteraceae bacterium]